MSQIDSLTAFFTHHMPPRAMLSFSSEIDGMKTIPAAKDYGLDQYRLSVIRYDAVLSWERYPYREYDPRTLLALLDAWLAGDERDLLRQVGITNADPDWDIGVIDDKTAMVVVSVPMAEELVIVRDDNGVIPHDGKQWRLADPVIWTALNAQIYGADGSTTSVGEG